MGEGGDTEHGGVVLEVRRGEAILLLAGTAGWLEQQKGAVQFTVLKRRRRRPDKLPRLGLYVVHYHGHGDEIHTQFTVGWKPGRRTAFTITHTAGTSN